MHYLCIADTQCLLLET